MFQGVSIIMVAKVLQWHQGLGVLSKKMYELQVMSEEIG